MASGLVSPHGGTLKNLVVEARRVGEIKAAARDWRSIDLTPRRLADLELLLNGGFSPLDGFMTRADAESVRDFMKLKDGTPWPTPIVLDASEEAARDLAPGETIALRDEEGVMIAALKVGEIWKPDTPGTRFIGGRVEGVQLPVHYDFTTLRLTPAELRAEFDRRKWSKVAAFQPKGPMHREEQAETLRRARELGAGLVLLPIVGMASPGDVDHYTRVRCHQATLPAYPNDAAVLALLPLADRTDDPKGAILRALVSRNYGCSHLFVDAVPSVVPDIGVTCVEFKTAPSTGTTFPQVEEELRRRTPERRRQGVTIFFTGLPSSGKSTVANVLRVKLLEGALRNVSLLDGDVARKNLSKGLGFSRQDRDTNIRRIGWVAAEIARHGGTAICCPIAPYDSTRKEIREMTGRAGAAFVLVHIATPVGVCETRDRKGLYAKARAGTIKEFTGVSDPYEIPNDAEVSIDTSDLTPEDCADRVLDHLKSQGYL